MRSSGKTIKTSSARRGRRNSKRRCALALGACALALGAASCGAPDESLESHGAEPVASESQASTASDWENLVEFASYASSGFAYAKTGFQVLQFLGVLPSPPSQQELLDKLQVEIEKDIGALSWQAAFIALNQRRPPIVRAAEDARGKLAAGIVVDRWGDEHQDSRNALIGQEADIAFKRTWVQPTWGIRQPPYAPPEAPLNPPISADGMGLVYDWRLGVPSLMEFISLRLQVISAFDSNWRTNPDANVKAELEEYRTNLLRHYDIMRQGVRCSVHYCINSGGFSGVNSIACVDWYTGISSLQSEAACPYPGDILADRDKAWDGIAGQMPFFPMKKVIDALYLYAHPGTADLTETSQQISLTDARDLCIELSNSTVAGSSAIRAVRLQSCTGWGSQQWVYDRQAGQIRNPATNLCLVPWDGREVGAYSCALKARFVQWSYDPSTGNLFSGVSPRLVLGAASASPNAALSLVTPDASNARWYADQQLDYLDAPASAVSLGLDKNHVFYRGTDSALWHASRSGGSWTHESLGGVVLGAPTARATVVVSGGSPLLGTATTRDRLDVFAKGTDNAIYAKTWLGPVPFTGGVGSGSGGPISLPGWSGYQYLGGTMVDSPAVVGGRPSRLTVAANSTSRLPAVNSLTLGWSGWLGLSQHAFYSTPAAVSWGGNRIDVFGLGADKSLTHAWSDGGAVGSESLGWQIGRPAVASWGDRRLDVLFLGTDRAIYHQAYNGAYWVGLRGLGGVAGSHPVVVSWGPGRLDAFVRGSDGALWHNACDGGCTQWAGWDYLGGVLRRNPIVTSSGPGRLEIFAVGTDGALYYKAWNNGWQPSVYGFEYVGGSVAAN